MTGGWTVGPGLCNPVNYGAVTTTSFGTVVTGGTANTKGSYTQFTASCTTDIAAILFQSDGSNSGSNGNLLDVATGAAGSEQVVIANIAHGSTGVSTRRSDNFFPVRISSGSRIAVRNQGTSASDQMRINLITFDDSWNNMGSSSLVDTYGALTGTSTGTAVTAGTANTKGAWAQITASTTADLSGFIFRALPALTGSGVNSTLFDIGTGASGSESVLVSNIGGYLADVNRAAPMSAVYVPLPIAASTRIAARVQSATASQVMNFIIYGLRA